MKKILCKLFGHIPSVIKTNQKIFIDSKILEKYITKCKRCKTDLDKCWVEKQ